MEKQFTQASPPGILPKRHRPRLALVPGLLIACCLLLLARCESTSEYQLYNEANQMVFKKDYIGAILQFDTLIEGNKGLFPGFNNRGICYFRIDSLDRALLDYEAAVAVGGQYPEALFNRAKVLQFKEEWQKAVASYDTAIVLLEQISLYLAQADTQAVDSGAAAPTGAGKLKPDQNWTTAKPPDSLRLYYTRSQAQLALKDAWLNRGRSYLKLKNYDEAMKDFTRLLEVDSGSILGHIYRGDANQALAVAVNSSQSKKLYFSALVDYDLAESLDTSGIYKEWITHSHANCLLGLRYFENALEEFDSLVAMNPKLAEYPYRRGNCLQGMREFDQAIEAYTVAMGLDPEISGPVFNRGNCYFVKEMYGEAAADYTLTTILAPDYANAWYMRGITRKLLGDTEGALSDLQKAGELGHPGAFAEIGKLNISAATDTTSSEAG